MKDIIPYKKEIAFGSKIAEITSMSLEHEVHVEPGEVHGDFIVSGDYKSHAISVNREPFLFRLPFSITLADDIDLDSVQFEITDFSYDLVDDETVEVSILFALSAEELPKVEEEKEEEDRSLLTPRDEEVTLDDLTNLMVQEAPILKEEEKEETVLETSEESFLQEEVKEEKVENEEDTILEQMNPTDDEYATYHIHIVNHGDTVETICTMYHANATLLGEYNDLSTLQVGDKVIIPKEDE